MSGGVEWLTGRTQPILCDGWCRGRGDLVYDLALQAQTLGATLGALTVYTWRAPAGALAL
ncbi:MAG TPA: hypothetical protein VEX13_03385 [Chloroflexia bacterium]|nr:hypothetical protein [Chloroflexia bacterium]